jgi:hypothetical protein
VIAPRWPLVPVVLFVWVAVALVVASAAAGRLGRVVLLVLGAFSASFTLVIGGISAPEGAFVRPALVASLLSVIALVLGETVTPGASDGGRSPLRRDTDQVALVSILACSAAAAGVLGASLLFGTSEKPFPPRLRPTADTRVPDSPLLVVRTLRESTDPGQVMVLDSSPSPWVRLAVLSHYNGRTWEVADRFQLTNGEIGTSKPGQTTSRVSFRGVDLEATGGWVPFVGRPVRISSVDVLRPAGSDAVAYLVAGSPPSKVSPVSSSTVGDVEISSADAETEFLVGTSTEPGQAEIAAQVCRALNARYADDEPSVGPLGLECGVVAPQKNLTPREVSEVVRRLTDRRARVVKANDNSPSSELLAQIMTLTSTRKNNEQTAYRMGSPEQFATAATLVFQSMGIPAVLVTGFRDDGDGIVTSAEATSWVELPTVDGSWVIVDPSPEATDEPKQEDVTVENQTTTTVTQTTVPSTVAPGNDEGGRISPPERTTQRGTIRVVLMAIGVMAGLLVAVRTLSNRRRRGRRRHGPARQKMIGEWHNLLETVHAAGVRELGALTATEVVDAASAVAKDGIPADLRDRVVAGANQAVFGVSEPEDADGFAAVTRSLERQVRSSMGLRKRFWGWLRPMPRRLLAHPVRSRTARRRWRGPRDGARVAPTG